MVVQRRCANYWALKSPSIRMSLDLGKGSKENPARRATGFSKPTAGAGRTAGTTWMLLNASRDDWFRPADDKNGKWGAEEAWRR